MLTSDAIDLGIERLPQRAGIPDPRREAHWLLAAAWGRDEVSLRVHPEREVPADVEDRYRSWLHRRASGEPAHHLTGSCAFWGREFEVNPWVLVPRPETELAVEVALALPLPANARVVDVGTGSGCIAATLAAERPDWRMAAVDSSACALTVAKRNFDRVAPRVCLWLGDLVDAAAPPWDLVVANLPYVPTARIAGLDIEVRYDPASALDGGRDGLRLVERLLGDLRRLLRPCGGAVLEIGEDQAAEVGAMAVDNGLAVARRVRDLGGCERVLVLQPIT